MLISSALPKILPEFQDTTSHFYDISCDQKSGISYLSISTLSNVQTFQVCRVPRLKYTCVVVQKTPGEPGLLYLCVYRRLQGNQVYNTCVGVQDTQGEPGYYTCVGVQDTPGEPGLIYLCGCTGYSRKARWLRASIWLPAIYSIPNQRLRTRTTQKSYKNKIFMFFC